MQKNKQKVSLATLLLSLFVFCSAYAQQKTISGVVTEANSGEPIIGASVTIKNTPAGTVTDVDGKFSLNVPVNGTTLVVSYIGFLTQELPIDKTNFSIVLKENTTALDELVVIGYGTARKKDLTGSVSTLQGSEIARVPVTSTAQAMTGRLPGVQITTADGSPDAQVLIRVRGGGSITGDNSPLFIVDGFPVSSINDIAPTDIQEITVLKDASSTAIYGSRGANGVILITTKNAEGGKTHISYNSYMQGKVLPRTVEVMKPYDFVMFNYEKAAMRKAVSNFEKTYGAYEDLELYQYEKGTDWQKDLFNHAGISQSHNLSINGGNESTKFVLSSTYVSDNSLMRNNGYDRFNLNFKLDHRIAKNLKMDFNSRISDTETNGSGTGGGTYKVRSYDAMMKAPVNGLDDFIITDLATLSEVELEDYLKNHLTLDEQAAQNWRKRNERRYNLLGGLTWNILKSLTYRLEGGYDYSFRQNKNWYGHYSNTAINNGGKLPMATWEKRDGQGYRIANTLTYNTSFAKKHHLNALIGQEMNVSASETTTMEGKFFQKDITPEKTFASMASNSGENGSRAISSSLEEPDKLASFFGRLNYNYADRYLLTATFRADGSSKFMRGNRWGYFPAAAFAWRISEESFMQSTQDYLSNLKLRLSYGEVGNNRIGSSMYETLYKAKGDSYSYGAGDILNPQYTLYNSQLANPNLKWETTVTRNAGLDFGFFKERLSGNVDLYWNTTKDLLVERQIVAPGYSSVMENIGQTSNRGVEISLFGDIVRSKDFTLNFNFNIGFNKNRVDKLADTNYMAYQSGAFSTDTREADDYRIIVGQPVGLMYGYIYDGIYGVDDFQTYVDGNGKTQFLFDSKGGFMLKDGIPTNDIISGSNGGVRPGAMKLKDVDSDGHITKDNDRDIIGRATPKNTGGFSLNTSYKNFDLSAMFNWVYGNSVLNMDKIVSTQSYRLTYSNLREYMNPATSAWTYLDRSTSEIVTDYETLKAMNAGKTYWSALTIPDNNPIISSWAVEDGSYLRFQNLTLGYTLPKSFTKKFSCSSLRVYGTVNNLYVWTNYTGYDPEVSSAVRGSSSSGLTPGADYSIYPKSLSWTIGLNVNF